MRANLPSSVALLLLITLVSTGCDSGGDDSSINGMWEARGTDQVFVQISSTNFKVYDYMGDDFDQGADCYEYSTLNISSRNGDKYAVSDPTEPDFQITITIKRSGENLNVTAFGETETFYPSNRTVASFTPVCASKAGSDKWLR